MTIADRKAHMRQQARVLRDGLDADTAGHALAGHALRDVAWPVGAVVGGTWPMRGEIDLRPLLHALHARGHVVVLPETPPLGRTLIFRVWQPDCRMVAGRFGTVHPDGPPATPDIVLVPLLAFDRAGHRLGYGGGYYDRTLAQLTGATPFGAAFADQEVEAVPTEPHDIPLQSILTERGVLTIGPQRRHAADTRP